MDLWISAAGGEVNILPLAMLAKSRNPANQMDLWISARRAGRLYIFSRSQASEIYKSRDQWIYGFPPEAGSFFLFGFMDYWPEAREVFLYFKDLWISAGGGEVGF